MLILKQIDKMSADKNKIKTPDIIRELREKYYKKYRMTPDNHKLHYISWLQNEYAELIKNQLPTQNINTSGFNTVDCGGDGVKRFCKHCGSVNKTIKTNK